MGTLAHFNLAGLRELHGLRGFVETGTAHGDGVAQALQAGFDPIHSIEIVPEIAQVARLRFKGQPQAQVWEGKSTHCLPMILKELPAEPCLFWLDAHFPGAHHGADYAAEQDASTRLPLADEVSLILAARPHARDVLLIDDARIYLPSLDYGGRDQYSQAIFDGTWPPIAGMARGIDWLRAAYGKTHGIVCDYADQGYLMLVPFPALAAAA